jgi:hypothetical protein
MAIGDSLGWFPNVHPLLYPGAVVTEKILPLFHLHSCANAVNVGIILHLAYAKAHESDGIAVQYSERILRRPCTNMKFVSDIMRVRLVKITEMVMSLSCDFGYCRTYIT